VRRPWRERELRAAGPPRLPARPGRSGAAYDLGRSSLPRVLFPRCAPAKTVGPGARRGAGHSLRSTPWEDARSPPKGACPASRKIDALRCLTLRVLNDQHRARSPRFLRLLSVAGRSFRGRGNALPGRPPGVEEKDHPALSLLRARGASGSIGPCPQPRALGVGPLRRGKPTLRSLLREEKRARFPGPSSGRCRDRTSDLLLVRQALSQLS
jgi:hypothetical protein